MKYGELKPIYILLTKYSNLPSRVIGFFAGCEYMHASIALKDAETFFSFNTKKGFCIETPFGKVRSTPCMLYRLDVPERVYDDIDLCIQEFVQSGRHYKFNFLGTFFTILHIPFWFNPFIMQDRYFCSQFISEILIATGAAELRKHPSRFLPKDFSKDPQFRLCYKGALTGARRFA